MPVRIAVAAQEVVVGDGRLRFDVPAAACVRHHADRPASRVGRVVDAAHHNNAGYNCTASLKSV